MTSAAVQPIVVLLSDMPGGNPTQYMIEKAFAHHNLDWRYLTVEVTPEKLGDAIRGMRAMGFRGGHCAQHLKQPVVPLLDRVSETAALVGAVNLVLRQRDALVGENTDGKGASALIRRATDLAGKKVAVLGAGRVARAVAIELAADRPAEITVVNRTVQRARELADLLIAKFQVAAPAVAWEGDYQVPAETQVLVNATSIGRGDADARLPISVETLRPEMLVADVTPEPPQTRLLREAAARGCKTLDGLGMYIEQVAIGIRLWTGVDPDRDVMREAIEEFWEL